MKTPEYVSPEAQLRSFIGRLDAQRQKEIRAVRLALRKRLPSANELAYDYSSFVVVAYSATDRAIDAILSFAGRPDGVDLYLNHGPQLPDPKKLLRGSGKQTRFIRLESARQLALPEVEALIAAAIDLANVPLAPRGRGALIIKTNKSGSTAKPTGAKPKTRRTVRRRR
jgi:hypothetical protein